MRLLIVVIAGLFICGCGKEHYFDKAGKIASEGDITEAVKAYEYVIAKYPNTPEAANSYYAIGDIRETQGDSAGVVDNYQKFIREAQSNDSKIPGAKYKIAETKLKEGDLPEAIKLYTEVSGQASEYSQKVNDRLTEIKNMGLKLADAKSQLPGNPDKAAEIYSGLLTLYPKYAAADIGLEEARRLQIIPIQKEAETAFSRKNYAIALSKYEEMQKLSPKTDITDAIKKTKFENLLLHAKKFNETEVEGILGWHENCESGEGDGDTEFQKKRFCEQLENKYKAVMETVFYTSLELSLHQYDFTNQEYTIHINRSYASPSEAFDAGARGESNCDRDLESKMPPLKMSEKDAERYLQKHSHEIRRVDLFKITGRTHIATTPEYGVLWHINEESIGFKIQIPKFGEYYY